MKISVVIPVYNTERYLKRCLDSVLNQTLQDFEIIVVNDHSLDHSDLILREYISDSRVRVIENEHNMGPMWTRRVGYQNAIGDYIVFCDSDDYLPISALETLYNAAYYYNADIVISAYTYVNAVGKKILKEVGRKRLVSQDNMYQELLLGNISHSLWAKIYDRRLFVNSSYDTFKHHTNSEDMILQYQLVGNSHRIVVIEESTYFYCQNLQSATQRKLSREQLLVITNSLNWQYNFMKAKTKYVDLLNARMLRRIFLLLTQDKTNYCIENLDPEFMKKIDYSFLNKYLNRKDTILFLILLHSPFFRAVFSIKNQLFRNIRLLLIR